MQVQAITRVFAFLSSFCYCHYSLLILGGLNGMYIILPVSVPPSNDPESQLTLVLILLEHRNVPSARELIFVVQ